MRDTKHLEKHANKLAESKKEKELFRTQRKAVEAGAHGTLEYTIKKGVNTVSYTHLTLPTILRV